MTTTTNNENNNSNNNNSNSSIEDSAFIMSVDETAMSCETRGLEGGDNNIRYATMFWTLANGVTGPPSTIVNRDSNITDLLHPIDAIINREDKIEKDIVD